MLIVIGYWIMVRVLVPSIFLLDNLSSSKTIKPTTWHWLLSKMLLTGDDRKSTSKKTCLDLTTPWQTIGTPRVFSINYQPIGAKDFQQSSNHKLRNCHIEHPSSEANNRTVKVYFDSRRKIVSRSWIIWVCRESTGWARFSHLCFS